MSQNAVQKPWNSHGHNNNNNNNNNNRVSRIFTMGSFGVTMEQVYDQCQKHNDQPTMQATGIL